MKDGIYTSEKLNIEDYHKDKNRISHSNLKHAYKSLADFKWHFDNKGKQEKKSYFDFGNAAELALCDPKAFDKEVSIKQIELWSEEAQKIGLKENGKEYKVVKSSKPYKDREKPFLEANKDKYIINDTGKESFESIERMLESCYKDKTIRYLTENIEYQVSCLWTCKETGLKLATRPDIIHSKKGNYLVDVKTIDDGSPESVSRQIGNLGYHHQAVMQIDGVVSSGLMDSVEGYYWLFMEKSEPYNATLYEFTKDDQIWAMDEYEYIKSLVADAFKTGNWPGYSQRSDNKAGILRAEIPLWCRRQ